MLIELIIALLLGCTIGTFTGLIPGIHINMIGALIISSSLLWISNINSIYIISFVIAMSITHTFVDFIPSIFLGAPEEGTELSVLPGHEMLKKGLGLQAVQLASLGCLIGLFIFVLMIFPLSMIADAISNSKFIQKSIPFVLIIVSLNVILSERKKFFALLAFTLSGILGLIVLNLDLREPLVPLLTGLFGMSSVILSIKSKTKISKQKINKKFKIKKLKTIIASTFFSPLSLFFPALSSGQIAVIGNRFAKADKKEFLFMLGIINVLAMSFSFLALFLLSKTRTGSAVVIKELVGDPSGRIFILIVFVILFSGFLSFFIVKFLAKKFILVLEKANYTKVSFLVLVIISIITLIASGFFGFFILIISTLTGISCITLNVSRINMMGCLLLPTIILYFLL